MSITLIKQTRPKSCNIACLQMIGEYYGHPFTESYILSKLPQHSFGNWLPEMGLFLESEGIETVIYTNSSQLPEQDSSTPSLLDTLLAYRDTGRVYVKSLTPDHFQISPAILNVDRAKLFQTGKGKTPHYIVVQRMGERLAVYDPLLDAPLSFTMDTVLHAAKRINRHNTHGLLLSGR